MGEHLAVKSEADPLPVSVAPGELPDDSPSGAGHPKVAQKAGTDYPLGCYTGKGPTPYTVVGHYPNNWKIEPPSKTLAVCAACWNGYNSVCIAGDKYAARHEDWNPSVAHGTHCMDVVKSYVGSPPPTGKSGVAETVSPGGPSPAGADSADAPDSRSTPPDEWTSWCDNYAGSVEKCARVRGANVKTSIGGGGKTYPCISGMVDLAPSPDADVADETDK